jgi:hypothetical protein
MTRALEESDLHFHHGKLTAVRLTKAMLSYKGLAATASLLVPRSIWVAPLPRSRHPAGRAHLFTSELGLVILPRQLRPNSRRVGPGGERGWT